jgi:uncharacterized protein (TIGR02453 family)
MEGASFSGFGSGARTFFKELSQNNHKDWFHANKHSFEKEIMEPAAAFVLELGLRLKAIYKGINYGTQRNGSGSIMRINRDIRFSPDKRPYKENVGLVFWIGEGKKVELPCFYFHMDAERTFFYGGQHMFPKDILDRYRQAVDDVKRGEELETILIDLDNQSLPLLEEPEYKRVPRGYPADHSRADLLRLKGLGVSAEISQTDACTPNLVELCLDYAEKMKPLIDWLRVLNENQR